MKSTVASQIFANLRPPAGASGHFVELVTASGTDKKMSLQIRGKILRGPLMQKPIEAANVTGFRLHRLPPRLQEIFRNRESAAVPVRVAGPVLDCARYRRLLRTRLVPTPFPQSFYSRRPSSKTPAR